MGWQESVEGGMGESGLGVTVDPSLLTIYHGFFPTGAYTWQGRLHLGSDDRSRSGDAILKVSLRIDCKSSDHVA